MKSVPPGCHHQTPQSHGGPLMGNILVSQLHYRATKANSGPVFNGSFLRDTRAGPVRSSGTSTWDSKHTHTVYRGTCCARVLWPVASRYPIGFNGQFYLCLPPLSCHTVIIYIHTVYYVLIPYDTTEGSGLHTVALLWTKVIGGPQQTTRRTRSKALIQLH